MIPAGAVDGVLLDYGHVLGRIDAGLLAEDVRAAGGRGDELAVVAAFGAAFAEHDRVILGGGDHELAWRHLMAVLVDAAWGMPAPAGARDSVVEAIWRLQPTRNLWRDVPAEARDLLAHLRSASIPVAIVSNAEGRARELLVGLGIAQSVDAIVDSGVLGIAKPDRRIFDHAAAELDLPLSRLVHVGDSESADVLGAIAAGAWAVRFDGILANARPSAAHAVARSYRELVVILDNALGRCDIA